ncbi:uncharacterized protein LOC144357802 [Saccoglossus kowalevskii]
MHGTYLIPYSIDKKPDKVRVVFDCAAKYKGTSLNDQLFQGPGLNNSLVAFLLQFRKELISMVADIKQMFHQVRVAKRDCDALRFLWWDDTVSLSKPVEYKMLVHPFGATSSPSCAAYALRRTADDNIAEFDPVVDQSFYDDCLKLVNQLPSMLAKVDSS